MKKKILILICLMFAFSCAMKTKKDTAETVKPYEATWIRINMTDSGNYVIYNYPSLWDDGATKSPVKIRIKENVLTDIFFSDPPTSFQFKDSAIELLNKGTFMFKVGNFYKFDYVDTTHHIAKWTIYHGDEIVLRVLSDYLYVDSLYNTYPIIDFEWESTDQDF